MTIAIHSLKDAVDQMLETASIVEHRLDFLPESEERDAVRDTMQEIRTSLSGARPLVENLGRRRD